ncbi:uncharacterized protein I303_100506 [Kwoniella dejecticola CBS 10117]|uniref:cAMP-independent regulatory protein n=1 Tax=Kwoniella dejecticola CBS 10117 TaxID=1296121 RepID=A0A1A6AF63_9TREE|nr:uncharacterized protein I303_00506 [Kwoniella dejecticola CBS 10117]OBR88689.1 hypothetical protein I303_00506 [Kwoniella dejecticola CBS 10117]
MAAPASPPPTSLDPPFRGYIETTFDALLVFEAARRGMIPRVTRRLIERERGMVQSGAVFVFDEHESGIKRWTDGLVWSPSRILGNFLVYRETDKRSSDAPNQPSSTSPPETSPSSSTPLGRGNPVLSMPGFESPTMPEASGATGPIIPSVMNTATDSLLGAGALNRARSASEGGGAMDRHRERQLVGSLTNSYKFKDGGLVKKTMSVSVNGFNQHMVSYYSLDDVLTGKLRAPSTIPELASLEISQEYLNKSNFRFPPMIERGADGVNRYRGEAEEPQSPTSPSSQYSFQSFPPSTSGGDYYDGAYQMTSQAPRVGSPRNRSVTVPMQIPIAPHPQAGYMGGPSSYGSQYHDSPGLGNMQYAPTIARQSSSSSIHSNSTTGAIRPGSSSRRYDPYGGLATSPRLSGGLHYQPSLHHRRQSQPMPPENLYSPPNSAGYDVKPNPYVYQAPSTAPSTFASFGHPDAGHITYSHHNVHSPITSPTAATFATAPPHGYTAWQSVPPPPPQVGSLPSAGSAGLGSTSRLLPRVDLANPPSSAGSGSTGSAGSRINTATAGLNGQITSPLHQGMSPAGPWHNQPNETEASQTMWNDGSNVQNGSSQNYIQPIHPGHDEWTRPNTGAIV